MMRVDEKSKKKNVEEKDISVPDQYLILFWRDTERIKVRGWVGKRKGKEMGGQERGGLCV